MTSQKRDQNHSKDPQPQSGSKQVETGDKQSTPPTHKGRTPDKGQPGQKRS